MSCRTMKKYDDSSSKTQTKGQHTEHQYQIPHHAPKQNIKTN
ncbi:hypothetical protein Hanom_Chr05g00418361 [Helianthus anomalus]